MIITLDSNQFYQQENRGPETVIYPEQDQAHPQCPPEELFSYILSF